MGEETRACNRCGGDMKLVPAGVSRKTGKQYKAFWACKDSTCGTTENSDGEIKAPGKFMPKRTSEREQNIRDAMDRKENSIAKLNAFNAAIELVVNVPDWMDKTEEERRETLKEIWALQDLFYKRNTLGEVPF